MCQAKIKDHYNFEYICLKKDEYVYDVEIVYGYGHKKGIIRKFTRTLCKKHAKTFRYGLNTKRKRGHNIIYRRVNN